MFEKYYTNVPQQPFQDNIFHLCAEEEHRPHERNPISVPS